MKRIVVGIALIVLLLLGAWWVSHYDSAPALNTFAAELRAADPASSEQVAERYLSAYSPRELLAVLEATYPGVQCHAQSHPLGRAVYKKTQNLMESIRMCGTGCNDGCFHGALMQMFSTDSDTLGGVINEESSKDYLAKVTEYAQTLCSRPEVHSVVETVFCIHGLGHVFAYVTSYSLDTALTMCSSLPRGVQGYCTTGVYMEYTGNPALREELRATDVSFCDAHPFQQRFCYRDMAGHWIARAGTAVAVLRECQKLKGRSVLNCIEGVSYARTKPNTLKTPDGVYEYCGILEGEQRDVCVNGAIARVYNNDSSGTFAECDALAPAFRDRCRAGLTYIRSF